jgi:hypothetical protein
MRVFYVGYPRPCVNLSPPPWPTGHYRAFLRLATQRVTFLSALPLGWRHSALGKFILICPGRIIGPCSRSSAETRAISKGASVAAVGEETPNRFRHRRRLSFRGIGGHDL